MALHVLSCQSHPEQYHAQFLASAARFGVCPNVLAPARWGGLTTKLQSVYRWLRTERLPENDVVLFADAWDTFFVRSLADFEAAWERLGDPVVFSAETNCAPHHTQAGAYPPAPTRYAYLNSGLYAGAAGALLDVLEDMRVYRLPEAMNDQGACTDYFLTHPERIMLDYHCHLFQSLYRAEEDMDYSGETVRNRLTGSRPFLVHGNGSACVTEVLAWLELNVVE